MIEVGVVFSLVAAAALGAGCRSVESAGPRPDLRDDYALALDGARVYERVLVPPLFGPWAVDLLERVAPRSGERVLDLACGTGVVTREAARRVGESGHVTGLDLSPGMLAVARESTPPAAADVVWRLGNAEELPFDQGVFDVAVCQQAVQFFGDRGRALAEVHRVLAPGGRLGVSTWSSVFENPYAAVFSAVVERSLGSDAAAESRSPFAGPSEERLRDELEAAGFRDVQVTTERLPMHTTELRAFVEADLDAYPTIGALLATSAAPRREILIEEILAALDEYRTPEGWSVPWTSVVATASR